MRREGKRAPCGHNYRAFSEIAGCVNAGTADGRGLRMKGWKWSPHMCQGNSQLPGQLPPTHAAQSHQHTRSPSCVCHAPRPGSSSVPQLCWQRLFPPSQQHAEDPVSYCPAGFLSLHGLSFAYDPWVTSVVTRNPLGSQSCRWNCCCAPTARVTALTLCHKCLAGPGWYHDKAQCPLRVPGVYFQRG